MFFANFIDTLIVNGKITHIKISEKMVEDLEEYINVNVNIETLEREKDG